MHCPFCAEEERLTLYASETTASGTQWRTFRYAVVCGGCGTHGPETDLSNERTAKDMAIDGWNNRVPHAEDLALRTAFQLE